MIRDNFDIIGMILNGLQEIFRDGNLFQASIWPTTPMALMEGIDDNPVDYQLSRYIWGLPGDVVFSRTLKCKSLFDH